MKFTATVKKREPRPDNLRPADIEVHVKGMTFCGKTDVTRVIAKALFDAGIDVEIINTDGDFPRGFDIREPVVLDNRSKANKVKIFDTNARPERPK